MPVRAQGMRVWSQASRAVREQLQPALHKPGTPVTTAAVAAIRFGARARVRGPTNVARLKRYAGAKRTHLPWRPSVLVSGRSPCLAVSDAWLRALQGHRASRGTWVTGRGRRRCWVLASA